MRSSSRSTSRRDFLKLSGAGAAALIIGIDAHGVSAASSRPELVANPFVKILADGRVVVIAKHFEMGQGASTGLATLVAEELDADWSMVEVEFAPANSKLYANTLLGAQATGGSTAIANSYEQYRKAGAVARDLLVRAAAATWNEDPSKIRSENGALISASGQTGTFGSFVEAAAKLPANTKVALKSRGDFKLIGKADLPRLDNASKTSGGAKFSIDVKLADMLTAVIARAPKFGATVRSFDDSAARKIKGVREVKSIGSGVVVYGENTWAAIKGRAALSVSWDFSKAEARSSQQIIEDHRKALDGAGLSAAKTGDVEAGLKGAAKTITAEFVFPYLAHAPMEPLNCVIRYDANGAEVWDGCQSPTLVQMFVAGALGLKPEQVKIHTLLAGGSFGRRGIPDAHYTVEAALAAKAIGGSNPVKVVWTREDDLTGGYYRPLFVERIEAGIDGDGKPVAWRHKLAGQSILIGTALEKFSVKNGIDPTSVEGAYNLAYKVANLDVDVRNLTSPVPVLWWRSVGHSHTGYSTEVAIDMLAHAAGRDAVAYRLELLEDKPRHKGVLQLAADKAKWSEPLAKGRARGVAVHESFNSFVAQVVEVSATPEGPIKIDRVVCAVDCGVAVNPDIIKAQMEGGIGYGLGAVMRNQITFDGGEVEQVNFPDYEPLRMSDMPEVEVHIVPSDAAPTGVGEPATPPIGPALANAIFALTGERITHLPMTANGTRFVG